MATYGWSQLRFNIRRKTITWWSEIFHSSQKVNPSLVSFVRSNSIYTLGQACCYPLRVHERSGLRKCDVVSHTFCQKFRMNKCHMIAKNIWCYIFGTLPFQRHVWVWNVFSGTFGRTGQGRHCHIQHACTVYPEWMSIAWHLYVFHLISIDVAYLIVGGCSWYDISKSNTGTPLHIWAGNSSGDGVTGFLRF